MVRLELGNVNAKFTNFNPRTEKEGTTIIPAADLQFSFAQGAEVLAFFSPTMRSTLFDLDGQRDLADGMKIRYPHLKYPLRNDEEMTGAVFKMEHGLSRIMTFADVKVKGFELTPKEGGSVIIALTVQCRPNQEQGGYLFMLQEQIVAISLEPAALPEMKPAEAA